MHVNSDIIRWYHNTQNLYVSLESSIFWDKGILSYTFLYFSSVNTYIQVII